MTQEKGNKVFHRRTRPGHWGAVVSGAAVRTIRVPFLCAEWRPKGPRTNCGGLERALSEIRAGRGTARSVASRKASRAALEAGHFLERCSCLQTLFGGPRIVAHASSARRDAAVICYCVGRSWRLGLRLAAYILWHKMPMLRRVARCIYADTRLQVLNHNFLFVQPQHPAPSSGTCSMRNCFAIDMQQGSARYCWRGVGRQKNARHRWTEVRLPKETVFDNP